MYSKNKDNYIEYNTKVITCLRNTSLYLDIYKYNFNVTKVKYLGLILTCNSLQIDLNKVIVIYN